MNKTFGSLSTIEIAELTREDILAYSEIVGEDRVLKEISDCQRRLKDLGIIYRT